MKHESDGDTNCNWCSGYSHQRIDSGTGGLENKRTSGDHPRDWLYTEKNPGDLRRLAVTQIPMRNHRLKLV